MADFFSPGFEFGSYYANEAEDPDEDDIDQEAEELEPETDPDPPVPQVQYNSPQPQSRRAARQTNRRSTLEALNRRAAMNVNQYAQAGGPRVPVQPPFGNPQPGDATERSLSQDPETQLDDASDRNPDASRARVP